MDKILKIKCEKEKTDFSDCIYRHSNVGIWAPYECIKFQELYDRCIQKSKINNIIVK